MSPRCKFSFSPACAPEGPLFLAKGELLCRACVTNVLGYEQAEKICGPLETMKPQVVVNGDEVDSQIPTVIIRW
jgi:hypothetical protein